MGFTSLGFGAKFQVWFCFKVWISSSIAFLHSKLWNASSKVDGSFTFLVIAILAYFGFGFLSLFDLQGFAGGSWLLSSIWLGRSSSGVLWWTPVCHKIFSFGDLRELDVSLGSCNFLLQLSHLTSLCILASKCSEFGKRTSSADHVDTWSNATFLDVWYRPVMGSQHLHTYFFHHHTP